MIDSRAFLESLKQQNIRFFAGVPDSLLKEFCECLSHETPANQHLIACNECAAVGLAVGHHLSTGLLPVVYLQNSGLGHIVNPLNSLADPEVYGIPILLMIGWRGEMNNDGSQLEDEPQHAKQGKVTLTQLDLLGIPYEVFDALTDDYGQRLARLAQTAQARKGPVAVVFRKNTFKKYLVTTSTCLGTINANLPDAEKLLMTREAAISICLQFLPSNIPIVSTTGMASREVFEYRKSKNEGHHRDFLTVGGMGCASQIALGISISKPDIRVACIDGDGAALMHMGALPFCAQAKNLIHIVINNGAHDSVGGQPTLAKELNLSGLALSCNYRYSFRAENEDALVRAIQLIPKLNGSVFIEVICKKGNRSDLGRPTIDPSSNKADFQNFIAAISA